MAGIRRAPTVLRGNRHPSTKRTCTTEQQKGGRVSEIIGLRTRLKPGMEEAYEKAHSQVWPDLVTVQRELGIEHWRIFRHGIDLFHVVECDDFDRAVAALGMIRSTNAGRRKWRST